MLVSGIPILLALLSDQELEVFAVGCSKTQAETKEYKMSSEEEPRYDVFLTNEWGTVQNNIETHRKV